MSDPGPTIEFDYVNYRGEAAHRVIAPISLSWVENHEYHGTGWILKGIDVARNVERDFDLAMVTNLVGELNFVKPDTG